MEAEQQHVIQKRIYAIYPDLFLDNIPNYLRAVPTMDFMDLYFYYYTSFIIIIHYCTYLLQLSTYLLLVSPIFMSDPPFKKTIFLLMSFVALKGIINL